MNKNLQMIQALWKDFFGNSRRLPILTGMVIFFCYGFMGCYITFNNDLAFFFDELWTLGFQVGRWGYGILSFLGFTNLHLPFWNACTGMMVFFAAVMLWGLFLYKASDRKLSRESVAVFMLLFASCPLNYEQFLYPAALTLHAFGFGLMILGTCLLLLDRVCWKDYLLSGFILAWSFAIYESYVPVFLLTAFFYLVEQYVYGNRRTFRDFREPVRRIALLLITAMIIFAAGALLTPRIFGYQEGANRSILWLEPGINPLVVFGKMCWHVAYDYCYSGLFYFAVLMFAVSMVLWALFCARQQAPRWLRTAAFFICPLLVFALCLLTGKSLIYRSAQTVVIATAVCWMLFWDRFMPRRSWRWILLFFLVFWQVKEINIWAFYDYRASERNLSDIRKIGYDLQEQFGRCPSKPIVFCSEGVFERSLPFIRTMPMQLFSRFPRYCYVNLHAGRAYFGIETYQFFELFRNITGLDVQRNPEASARCQELITREKLPAWPRAGYITEQKDCILVNLGRPPVNVNAVTEPSDYLKNMLKPKRRK